MVMTAAVIEELSGLGHTRTCCRRAEVATLLRFAGAVHVVAGQVVISAEVDGAGVAGWLRKAIRETFGYPSDVRVLPTAVGRPSGARYLVRVLTDGAALGRQTGLLDLRGRPIRGLPPHVVAGRVCDAEAVWRAAFLARGSLADRGGSPALEVSCPTPEAAMALVGAARRLGITAVLLAPYLAPVVLVLVAVLHRSALARHLQAATTIDAKTGLLTCTAWHQQAERLLRVTRKALPSSAVLMIDLDHFKVINDSYGHLVGDEVLQAVAQRLTRQLRSGDLLGRFGGEEFVVLLLGADATTGHEVAERMRRCLHTICLDTAPDLQVSASMGLAVYPDHGGTLTDVLRTADHTVYAAKDAGRDTTLTAHPTRH